MFKAKVTNITQIYYRKKNNSEHNGQCEPKYYTLIDIEAMFTPLFKRTTSNRAELGL